MKKMIVTVIAAGGLFLSACGSTDTTTTPTVEETRDIGGPVGELAENPTLPPTEPEETTVEETVEEEPATEQPAGPGSLQETMDRVGIPEDQQPYLTAWAPMACQMSQQMGISDSEAAGHMVTDLAGDVDLTEDQAAQIWPAVKTVC